MQANRLYSHTVVPSHLAVHDVLPEGTDRDQGLAVHLDDQTAVALELDVTVGQNTRVLVSTWCR